MDNKEKVKKDLQEAVQELKKIMNLDEPIKSNWNDEIATTFESKYKKIEKDITNLINEIEELQKII